TAGHVAARIDNEGNAFSLRDWRFQAQAAACEPMLPADARAASVAWAPWRGYAAMALWAHASAPARETPPFDIQPLPSPRRVRRDGRRRAGSRPDAGVITEGCPLPASAYPALMKRSTLTSSRSVIGQEDVAMHLQLQADADPEQFEGEL